MTNILRCCAPLALAAVVLVGCSTPRVPQRPAPPPPPAAEREVPAAERAEPEAGERFLDREIRRQRQTPEGPGAYWVPPRTRDAERLPAGSGYGDPGTASRTDPAASEAWLRDQVDRRTTVAPVPPPERVVERIYVQQPVPVANYGYAPRRGPGFPINTAVGAGIGAIIGNQSGDAAEGAWIGAGFGLLYDLMR